MSWLSRFFTVWTTCTTSLFFVGLVGRQLRLRVGLEVVQTVTCSRWSTPSDQGLFQDGDIIIDPSAGNREEITVRRGDQPVPLIIGGDSSITAQILAKVLGPLSVPLVSYTASCSCLSDRVQYPNFFRTMPSDFFQARAIAQLAIHFNWTWIGAVAINTNYGIEGIKIFQEVTQEAGVCLTFTEVLNRENIVDDARRAALTIQASTARVILIFAWYTDVKELFLQLAKINVTDRQFLASEAWSTSGDILQDPKTRKVGSGVLGVAIRSSTIPGFESYLRNLNPSLRPGDSLFKKLWENVFGCSPSATPISSSAPSLPLRASELSTSLPPCSGTESLEGLQHPFTYTSQLRVTYNVYLAVYAAAHALHSLLSCPNSDSHGENNSSSCSFPKKIEPIELLRHLNNVNVTTPHGETFYFQDGDIPAKYDLVNWQNTPEGTLQLVLVGRVDGFDIHLNETAVQWNTGSNQVPASVCSESCPPGTRMANRKGEPVCCFDCIQCADGEISNKSGSLQCERCPLDFWSNANRTACVPRQLDFLAFNETLGITLTTVAVSGIAVTTAVFVVFLRYRQTPVVRTKCNAEET
ncbi:hypothetical protein Q8A73_006502 [Channa argus]|nr:hypothetical protein Q8A73_006502 [Channa argus]